MAKSPIQVDTLGQRVCQYRPDSQQIAGRRDRIQRQILAGSDSLRDPDFSAISRSDVLELVIALDLEFLEGATMLALEATGSRFSTRVSKRMTNAGGMTILRKPVRNGVRCREYEIAVSAPLLFNTRFDSGSATVAGVPVASRLDALQRIVEHELVHLVEMIVWDHSSCARKRFREIATGLFGHRESSHSLMTFSQSARSQHGIACGDEVAFSFQGRLFSGRVNRIGRRATVLVPDPEGERFSDGRFYRRYYVPVNQLRKA